MCFTEPCFFFSLHLPLLKSLQGRRVALAAAVGVGWEAGLVDDAAAEVLSVEAGGPDKSALELLPGGLGGPGGCPCSMASSHAPWYSLMFSQPYWHSSFNSSRR